MGQGTLKSIRSYRIAVTPQAYMLEGMQGADQLVLTKQLGWWGKDVALNKAQVRCGRSWKGPDVEHLNRP